MSDYAKDLQEDAEPQDVARVADQEFARLMVMRALDASFKAAKAKREVYRLCGGGRWHMSVPVDNEWDSDMIIIGALDSLKREILEERAKSVELFFALRELYSLPCVRDVLVPAKGLGNVADRVEAALRRAGIPT